jgi:hypothetical protein
MVSMECPKCHGSMEEGFIKDEDYGNARIPKWVEGAPERSWLMGTKTHGKTQLEIASYRCSQCGYLESYAK